MIFVIYIIISLIFGFIGLITMDENSKINYSMFALIIALIMLIISPLVAHCYGIY